MKKLLVVNFEGVNYYTFKGCKTVNMTYDEVNNENCENVSDFNCFNVQEDIQTKEALEVEIMDFVADNKLHDEILRDLLKVTDNKTAHLIVRRIGEQRAILENPVLADYDYLTVEDNVIIIYSKKDDCDGVMINFTNDLRVIGDIVG